MAVKDTVDGESLFGRPDSNVGYVVVVTALVTGVLHVLATTKAVEFDQVLAALFLLNGLGFLAFTVLYLSHLWRKELFLVLAAYSVATILALFVVHGWSVEAFYMEGELNPVAVATKLAEAVLAVAAVYLYVESEG